MRRMILLFVFIVASQLCAVTFIIDSSKTYQTIEGLGAAVASHMLELHDNTGLVNKLVNDLGMSMLRIYPTPAFERVNDNHDPNTIDWTRFDTMGMQEGGLTVRRHMNVITKFKAAGMDRIILSVFTPAGWMKTNGSEIGGRLRPDMYEEFAEFYSAYIQAIKKNCGVDVYAISPQNEPRWEQWYDSCVYSYTEMRDVIPVLGKRFERENIDVKIFAAEDLMGQAWMNWTQPWTDYYRAIMADEEAKKYCDIVAVHTYEDGVAPSDPSAKIWEEVYTAANTIRKPVWMTETSGYTDNWDGERGGFALTKAIYAALRFGNCSAWVWLNAAMRRGFNPDEGLIIYENDGSVSYPPKYHAVKQYFKFIRPGAIRVESSSDDEKIGTLAFINEEDNSQTLLIINSSNFPRDIDLTNMDLTGYKIYRTSRTENCELIELESDTMRVTPVSITTLYKEGTSFGENGVPSQFNLHQNFPNPFNPNTNIKYSLKNENKVNLDIYDILGRQVKSLVSQTQKAGEYDIAWDGTDASGNRLGSGFYFCKMQVKSYSQVKKMILLN